MGEHMKVVEINSVFNGSTGKIMMGIASVAHNNGIEAYCCATGIPNTTLDAKYTFQIGNKYTRRIHSLLSYVDGQPDLHSSISTRKLINYLERINPDIIHLHNLHGFFIDIELLFSYIKKSEASVVWTLHDCWPFTGRCPYFDLLKCDLWENGCLHCNYPKEWYPRTIRNVSGQMWIKKRQLFTGIKELTIVTPSEWMSHLVHRSFLKDYPVKVINNGIDLSVFKATASEFRTKHECRDKYILLGVAFDWGKRKGLDVFIELSRRLNPSIFQIVLVGTNNDIDRTLPRSIISIHRTNNQEELAEIYSAANLFINPTREDNYPTVNMESIACGTPVLTFETGGSQEIVDEMTGSIVKCDDINALEKEIYRIHQLQPFSSKNCQNRAAKFDMKDRFEEYSDLYKAIVSEHI